MHRYILFGGDINVNIDKQTTHASVVKEFISTYELFPGYCTNKMNRIAPVIGAAINLSNVHDNSSNLGGKAGFYTFSNKKLGRYITSDFLFVTKNAINCVTEYKTLDSESNDSDHLGLLLSCTLPSSSDISEFIQSGHLLVKTLTDMDQTKNDIDKRLR